jgi:hypothetical protein
MDNDKIVVVGKGGRVEPRRGGGPTRCRIGLRKIGHRETALKSSRTRRRAMPDIPDVAGPYVIEVML